MGTSGAYGGTGGAWTGFDDDVGDWVDSLPPAPPRDGPDDGEGDGGDVTDRPAVEPSVADLLRPVGRALRGWGRSGGADGPGGGGAGGGRGGGTAGGDGGGRASGGRSRARAATVGGRLAFGIAGLQAGDGEALAALGLDLAELRALADPYRQAQRLLQAATDGVPQSLEDDELRVAASRTAVWALATDGASPSVEDIVRHFVTEYVYEIVLTEAGSALRTGHRDGTAAIDAERRIRTTIAALARGVDVRADGTDRASVTSLVDTVLENTRMVLGAGR